MKAPGFFPKEAPSPAQSARKKGHSLQAWPLHFRFSLCTALVLSPAPVPGGHLPQTQCLFPRLLSAASRKRSMLFKFLLGRTAPIFQIVENRKNLQLWFLHYPVASRACSIFIQFNSDSMVSIGSPVYFAIRFTSIPSASIAFASSTDFL